MLKYQTATQYRAMLRDLSTADLLTLSESHVNDRVKHVVGRNMSINGQWDLYRDLSKNKV